MEALKFPTSLSKLTRTDSSSATAIRRASSPWEALSLFKARLLRRPPAADPYDSHAVVYTLKHCSSSPASSSGGLIPSLHARILKTNLLSFVHVASALLHGYSISSLSYARLLFDEIPHRNVVTCNTMITSYERHGDIPSARKLFDEMPQRDVASWSAIICAYMHKDYHPHAFSLFREMILSHDAKPDPVILVQMLSICADAGSPRLPGNSIHGYLVRNCFDVTVQLGTSLIDMYVKSGSWRSAFYVFDKMPERNVMHWTAMICGLAVHGHSSEALAFFERMKASGVRPNTVSFTGALNACRHAGMVEAGHNYFCNMVEEFGLEPEIYHYGCMVDLFANAGRLQDAFSMIEGMKLEPNIVIWTSVLAGCKKYKNFDIAEKVIERVLQVAAPDDDGGVFTLVSDLYALGGRWNDVEKVRKLMDRLNVKKKRGSSFIELESISNR